MTVRDYRALEGLELVGFDVELDHARAVKSEAELASVRDSVRINRRGFEIWFEHYAPGKTAAEVMAAAEEWFLAEGCGRLTMNMVLTAPGRSGLALPEFKIARKEEILGDFVLPSLEVAGPGMHWVEVSRAVAAADTRLSADTEAMMEAYAEYYEAAKHAMRAGATCHDVHVAVSKGFHDRGYHLGHVTGHSIGMTMIEFPKVGEGVETVLEENMVLSMHPHAIAANGEDCLYMQDTWLVTADGGVPLADLPMEIFRRLTLADGLVENEDGVVRCWWGAGDHDEYRAYHDHEWGMPVTDDRRLFEKLCLEGFQSGLSWLTILRKREGFRHAFAGFDPERVAAFGARDVERLLEDAAIVRHRGKIESTINNARRALELIEDGGLARRATSGGSSRLPRRGPPRSRTPG